MVAVLMSHLMGAEYSNANIDSIYFFTKNVANDKAGCGDGRLCAAVEMLTDMSHFYDL